MRPEAKINDAAEIASRLYSLDEIVQVVELNSYDDRNFMIVCANSSRFVIKIHNAQDSQGSHLASIEAQDAAMQHLAAHGITCSEPVPSRSGALLELVQLPCAQHLDQQQQQQQQACQGFGALHAVRCLTFVPGSLLKDWPQTAHVQWTLGAFMGRVSVAFASPVPGADADADAPSGFHAQALCRDHKWHMPSTSTTVCTLLPAAALSMSPKQLTLVQDLLKDWHAALPSLHAGLPCQVCHGDANESNVLVSEAADGQLHMALIDFGDTCHTWAVTEVAVTMLYAMLLTPTTGEGGQMAAGARVLAGYLSKRPLLQIELECLPLLLRARLAVSLCSGLEAVQRDPGNAAYVLATQAAGWGLLEQLTSLGPEQACAALGAKADAAQLEGK